MEKKEKISRQSLRKQYTGPVEVIVTAVSVVWMLFQILLASGFLYLTPRIVRMVHLAFCMVMVFLLTPAFRKEKDGKLGIINIALVVITVAVMAYSLQRYEVLKTMIGRVETVDVVLGICVIVLMYEAGRRVASPGLSILSLVLLAYACFGQYLSGSLAHSGFTVKRIVSHLTAGMEGIYGFALGVTAETLVVFVIFGCVLQEVGIGDYFYELASAMCGRSRGGPAKVAVISSALMGMVSGETSANVATTGAFTIPLMKRIGYDKNFAGAVECTASAGGQILPPVMGATAFMVADTLNIPYGQLAIAALLPAILYYIACLITVHFRAVKLNLVGDKDAKADWLHLLKNSYLLLPIVGVVVMLCLNRTATFAAFWGGIVVALVISFFKKETRITLKKIVGIFVRSAKTTMTLGIATAIVGIIVGSFSLTGITMTISRVIFNAAGGRMFFTLFLTMIVAMILGMGMPTSAAYVLCSISAVPTLTTYLGLAPLPAHLFVFYFGCMSTITPPVATGAYAAAALSDGNPNKIGFMSMRLAIAGFIVPFIFIYTPELLLGAGMGTIGQTVFSFVVTALGLIFLCACFEGALFRDLKLWERLFCLVPAVMLIWPATLISAIGLAVAAVFGAYEYLTYKKATGITPAAGR